MKSHLIFVLLLFMFIACKDINVQAEKTPIYSHWIGDILFDSKLDKSTFQVCDSTSIVHRRNALTYLGGKKMIKEHCLEKFEFQSAYASFSGYIMIRFILNCQQETGRFRVESLAGDFSLKDCPESLKNHLLDLTKSLKDWKYNYAKDENSDCSKYINFKIKNGKIENILH